MAEKENKSKAKRVFSIICTVISVLIFAFVALLIINMIVCRVQNRPVNFFGYSFSVVQTNSMEPEIMTGDLIVFKKVDFSTLDVGDTIVFKADDNFKDGAGNSLEGYTIVHKIMEVTAEGLVTKGVNNVANDGGLRTADEVYGICVANSAFWGDVFAFLGKYGIIIIIFIIAVPIIVTQIIKLVKYSKEKTDEDCAEGTGEALDKSDTLNEENDNTSDE